MHDNIWLQAVIGLIFLLVFVFGMAAFVYLEIKEDQERARILREHGERTNKILENHIRQVTRLLNAHLKEKKE
jgi:membrane-anchored glycerophosphoryl diester phosphodiesterase (GDPDase)